MRIVFLLIAGLFVIGHPSAQPRASASFHGRVVAGDKYEHRFGPDFTFVMEPTSVVRIRVLANDLGWDIAVLEDSGGNIAEMTPPFGGPREQCVYATYFMPGGTAPGREHGLIFSPEVGHTITWESYERAKSNNIEDASEQLKRIEAFGSLNFTITDMKMHGTTVEDAAFDWIEFDVKATWPADYKPTRP